MHSIFHPQLLAESTLFVLQIAQHLYGAQICMQPQTQYSKGLVFQSCRLPYHAGAVVHSQVEVEIDLVGEVVVVTPDSGGAEEILDDSLGRFFCCGGELAGMYACIYEAGRDRYQAF